MTPNDIVVDTLLNGGGTYSINGSIDKVNRHTGFAVGGFSQTVTIRGEEWTHTNKLDEFISSNQDLFNDGLCLGTWLRDEKVWLDVTAIVDSKQVALSAARGNGELAIYDFDSRSEVNL